MKKRHVTSRNLSKHLSGMVFTSHIPVFEKYMQPVKVTIVICHLALSKKDVMSEKVFVDLDSPDTLL